MENREKITNFLAIDIINRQNDILTDLCKMLDEKRCLTADAIFISLVICSHLINNFKEMDLNCRPEFGWFNKVKRLLKHSLNTLEEIIYCFEIMIDQLLEYEDENSSE